MKSHPPTERGVSQSTLSRARALIEAAEKATAAPWDTAPTGAWRNGIVSPAGDAELGNWMVAEIIRWTGDRDFIIAARNDAPAIAAALVEALAAHQALGESIRLYAEGCIRDGVVDRADDAHMAVALPNQRH